METIKSYLEAMFANMPNTPEVKKAKDELFSMMEDKYNELIADGVNENTAVGTVISEFGNLDELAESLGLEKEVEEVHEREQEIPRRFVSMEEVYDFIASRKKSGLFVGLGVMLCIVSVCGPIITDEIYYLSNADKYGVLAMFMCIAVAIGLFVFNGLTGKDWDFLKKQPCQIDMATANMVKEKRKDFKITRAWMHTVGILLCAFCWLPCAMMDNEVCPVLLFFSIGIGVLLLVYSSYVYSGYETILSLNDQNTISGRYGKEEDVEYVNDKAKVIMEVYWSTVTCIYLIISFITFRWDITWLIWPIGVVINKILKLTLTKEED
ncbi:MAG: hypothetical protein J6Y02_18530 [Pseudobutyrivibrio sp.]|nr:hypothetical protein [Pseudobutyrivibrio sp.]